jgi:uncharacterized membrane-anchored protein YhcB (DUF1043 family)
MIGILAQLPDVTPSQLGSWLITGAAALAIGVLLKSLLMRKPSFESEFATKAEMKIMEADMKDRINRLQSHFDTHLDKLDQRIVDQLATLDNKRSHQVAKLHEDIRDVGEAVARLEGSLSRKTT